MSGDRERSALVAESREIGMSACTNCGAVLANVSAFCGKCKASQIPSVVTAADVAAPQNTKTSDGWKAAASSAGLAPNVAAALSYAFGAVSGVIFLFVEPFRSNAFVRFHALQSIFFMVAWVIFTIMWTVATEVFEAITGGFLITLIIPIDCLLTLAGIGYWVSLMYRAYAGDPYKVPILGWLAERQANKK